jgi:deoxyribodipyrimidine photo-lyase
MRSIWWLRNDLRLSDNPALRAAAGAEALVPVFVLDPKLLRRSRRAAPRLRFLLDSLERLARDLEGRGSRLVLRSGDPSHVLARLVEETGAERVYWNRDVTPYALARDRRVRAAVGRAGARAVEHKDRSVFERDEIRKADGGTYTVYGAYRRAWLRRLQEDPQPPCRAPRLPAVPRGTTSDPLPDPRGLGVERDATRLPAAGEGAARRRLRAFLEGPARDYARLRDLPGVDGTSRLSPYLRFGAISIRVCLAEARALGDAEPRAAGGVRKWIDELIWRDFYAQILEGNPHVLRGAFRPEYEGFRWSDDERGYKAWREGRTGYPIVDAGMRQLAETGWMHNRARMIVASFLAKDLLIDWRLGERHFFERLVDGDPASNNGGWQWSAGSGTDAQPFFRIFNPTAQGERFDPDGRYVRRWVPELRGLSSAHVHRPCEAEPRPADYPPPIVDHAERRALALERFKAMRRRRA